MSEGERVAYGGHWWKLDEDGLILRYDERRGEWDLWGENLDEPLPPPQFLKKEDADRGASLIRRSFSRPALSIAGAIFVLGGLTWIVSEAWLAILFTRESGFFGDEDGRFLRELQVVSRVSYAIWQVSVGAVVVITAFAISRYVRLRNLLED